MAKLSTEERDDLSKSSFAFPKQRKEPLENADGQLRLSRMW